MTDQAIILAAGRGKRMMPLTRDIPKPMLRIGNMTLIEDKIIRLSEAGIKKIVINTGYLGSYIHEHVGDGSKYGIEIVISDEGDMPIGTANGIRNIMHEFNEKPFIVVNADIWTNYLFIDLLNMKLNKETFAHLVFTNRPDYLSGDFNITNNKICEGTDYIYTGIGLYKPELFMNYKDIEIGSILHKEKNISAEIYEGLWDDVGTPERLNMIRKRLSL
ncbi:MAG: nucleotidyltransferase family protein [Gammaproteobacteria bacterium]|jgi:N-acetyl-alpha-D-muramate 1-phosphate uridylyltransferase|nr:nucleotidyltransferase family protein [Gammaproteobacteria bacterium]MBT4462462.1 nucleotidyltransferase family protein [Gammaproteobacteria bacterium]MBT4654688.1 nucleotidyltransferase family protein [Gammaproteobacteria bacterium]MBT5116882.1 nucleotidyltransferase family protein [Gammaproteobacteria bacterium]MBT5761117.1 nucleotidyltransferase family protein [Gammaproteobacteria bacterium]